jgi:hypothetical protein
MMCMLVVVLVHSLTEIRLVPLTEQEVRYYHSLWRRNGLIGEGVIDETSATWQPGIVLESKG